MTDTIDRDAIRARYRAERDKRLRPDGNDQYVQPTGKFAHLLDDPYTPRVEREPRFDEVTVAVIGGGFSGLTTGARLTQAGLTDVRSSKAAATSAGPGTGTATREPCATPRRWSTCRCSRRRAHAEHEVRVRTRDLRPREAHRHHVRPLRARAVLHPDHRAAVGRRLVALDHPHRSRRRDPGPLRHDGHRARFTGRSCRASPASRPTRATCFHTSRWDYDYHRREPRGRPAGEARRKRVGIIGTGATAVQCIPALARDSGELFVFQRTPSSIDVRNNHPIDPEWFATLGPGWQQRWLTNFATLQTGGFADEDLVKDGWTDISQRIRDRMIKMLGEGATFGPEAMAAAYEESDDEKMEEIRARVDTIVRDPATAAALKPWYRQLCKRPCFHDEYLQAYNVPTAHLIDTDGKGVERIDETGVWANGVHYEVDVLIFASGFEVGTSAARRSGFETYGRDGLSLSDAWAEGMQSFHGMHVHDFPNLFVVGPSQGSNLISNITQNLTEAGTTIAKILNHALALGAERVEVTEEADGRGWRCSRTVSVRSSATPTARPATTTTRDGRSGARNGSTDPGIPRGRSPTGSTSSAGATPATSPGSRSTEGGWSGRRSGRAYHAPRCPPDGRGGGGEPRIMQSTLDIPYSESRNRVTVLVRIILVIPHLVVYYVLNIAAQIATFAHWFIQVFTGKRNPGIAGFVSKVIAYQARILGYSGLLFDEYPGFFDDQGKTPARIDVPYSEGPVNRLTVALRLIWAIPAAIIAAVIGIAVEVVTIICWFAIVITGKQPRGMFDFCLKGHRFALQVNTYVNLLTDTYPKYA
jgi:cation diffusion facilitator CzcD-associated flavoprotein CzcO